MLEGATSIITYDTGWQACVQRKSSCRLLRSPEHTAGVILAKTSSYPPQKKRLQYITDANK